METVCWQIRTPNYFPLDIRLRFRLAVFFRQIFRRTEIRRLIRISATAGGSSFNVASHRRVKRRAISATWSNSVAVLTLTTRQRTHQLLITSLYLSVRSPTSLKVCYFCWRSWAVSSSPIICVNDLLRVIMWLHDRADNGTVGHGSNGSTYLDGSHGSFISICDPLTHE